MRRPRRRVSLRELADEVFVGAPPGSVGSEAVDRVFSVNGTGRKVPRESNDPPAILDFVAHGFGITLIQQYLAVSRRDLCAVPLDDETLTWNLTVVTPTPSRTTPAATALVDLLV
ncbi:MAG: LysR substrate-binding domain-containing protein [Actinomycetota bacterium]